MLFAQLCSLGTSPPAPGAIPGGNGRWEVFGKAHCGDGERTTELSAFTSATFVHGGTETAWAEIAFNPAEVTSVQRFGVHGCCLQRDYFLSMAGRCFQVCQEDQNIPRLLLRSFCVADKVAVFSSVGLSSFRCCFQGIFEAGSCVSPNIQVHVLSPALSSCWQQFPCHFRCFCIVLSNCVFYK